MSMDCNQTKEQLEILIDQMVDAKLQSKIERGSNFGLDSTLRHDQIEASVLPFNLPAQCQEHLNQCSDCRDYQAASGILIESAALLPLKELAKADELTASIMQQILAEPSFAVQPIKASNKDIYLVTLSFVAFAATSVYGLQVDESLWNIGSWLVALIVFAACKPLIEARYLERNASGFPA